MAYTYDQILNAHFQNLDAAQAQAAAELEAARHAEDPDRVNSAAEAILTLDLQRNALAQRAQGYAGQQQQAARQPISKYGLTPAEQEAAKISLVDRPDCPKLSQDDRERIYRENRDRYHGMLASGAYSRQTKG